MKANWISYPLKFIRPAGTSRGVLKDKACWFIRLEDEQGDRGIGEVSFIPGLSPEDPEEMDILLDHLCKLISRGEWDPAAKLPCKPGVQFALETALLDLKGRGSQMLFDTPFSRGEEGIPTNGLIWMGPLDFMEEQIREKMQQGFRVLKLKVGALDPADELGLLTRVRREYAPEDLEIRLDANGAWSPSEAMSRLESFAEFDIHSIEQPIAAGKAGAMAEICRNSPIAIALDEELLGKCELEDKKKLVRTIHPHYLILKPGLLGGFRETEEWIDMATLNHVDWWVTSALESAIGLNAIAQWTSQLETRMHQGLGTGTIYMNNIESPLQMKGEQLWHSKQEWDLSLLKFK